MAFSQYFNQSTLSAVFDEDVARAAASGRIAQSLRDAAAAQYGVELRTVSQCQLQYTELAGRKTRPASGARVARMLTNILHELLVALQASPAKVGPIPDVPAWADLDALAARKAEKAETRKAEKAAAKAAAAEDRESADPVADAVAVIKAAALAGTLAPSALSSLQSILSSLTTTATMAEPIAA